MKFKMLLSMAIVALLAGCATAGNDSLKDENSKTVSTKITEGKSTMGDVKAAFGAPMTTTYTDGGLEVWKYEISHMSADATSYIPVVSLFAASSSGTKKELTILFDKDDKVQKYKMTESPVKVRTGLFNQ